MNFRSHDATERALARLIDVLVALLVPLDVTPARLAQLARAAFVKVEAGNAKVRSSGRPHIARIAARTGLSRIEVKRIVSANFNYDTSNPEYAPRALRVLHSWKASKEFTLNGRPRALSLNGRTNSFQALCKRFSGDIPHRVILRELESRGFAKVNAKRTQVSVSRIVAHNYNKLDELNTLTFAATVLEELANKENILVRRRERIAALDKIPTSYVENAIADRVTELLDNLPQLFTPKGSKRMTTRGVNVYAVVSRSLGKGKA